MDQLNILLLEMQYFVGKVKNDGKYGLNWDENGFLKTSVLLSLASLGIVRNSLLRKPYILIPVKNILYFYHPKSIGGC